MILSTSWGSLCHIEKTLHTIGDRSPRRIVLESAHWLPNLRISSRKRGRHALCESHTRTLRFLGHVFLE